MEASASAHEYAPAGASAHEHGPRGASAPAQTDEQRDWLLPMLFFPGILAMYLVIGYAIYRLVEAVV
jgi:hypothetical protein